MNTTTIDRVTVFLQGAQITRSRTQRLEAGKHVVRFEALPEGVRAESVEAAAGDGVELLGARFAVQHLEKPELPALLQELEERLQANEDALKRNEDELSNLEAEAEFLRQNRQVGGEAGLRLEELRGVADYHRERLRALADARFNATKQREKLTEQRQRLEAELGICHQIGVRAVGEIAVEVAVEEACEARVSVSYFVPCAGWTPLYEIRVADTVSPAVLLGKGVIRQTTGEDWTDVPLTLSSGAPSFGGTQPELRPWYLDFERPAGRSEYQAFNVPMAAAPMMERSVEEMTLAEPEPSSKLRKAPRVQATQAQTSIEFVLLAPVSVPSADEGVPVDIARHELAATYRHYSVRKLDKDVYLLARIEGWEQLSLLAGEVSVFLGNTYVGATCLDPRRAGDTLELSLGRDAGVIVTRVKGRDFAGRSLLGKSAKASREWELTVRNTRGTPIEIEVLDQLPVSVNKSIVVEPVELSGAEHDAETGELRWVLQLEPGQSRQMSVKYAVTYPRGTALILE